MTGPQLAEEEYSPQGVSSIGEAGAIDMTGVAEYQVCCQSTSAIVRIFLHTFNLDKKFKVNTQCCMLLG